jgi:endonuclease/exonuclease/phosphatase family metal-dependent hydrolase
MVGCSRDGKNATSGEWGTILYSLERFELLDSNDFWLTNTPNKVSRVSGAKCNRICTWALLKDKFTGETFVFANTHLDHSTDAVRLEQLGYLLDNLSEFIGKYPIYLTGDFNAKPDSDVYKNACKSLNDAHMDSFVNDSEISYTYDSYGTKVPGSRIDYCFYNDRSIALEYKILNEQFGGYVSDHYGIITEFVIK